VKAQFKFLSGARAGQVETFQKGYLGIGRHPLSDVRFDAERDLDVSSRHAAIMAKSEGFVLQDLGSKNGTYVNGQRIEGDRLLKDGDVIGFGAKGPALEFHALPGGADDLATATAEAAAGRMSQPKQVVPAAAGAAPPTRNPPSPSPSRPRSRSTTAIIELATRQWRRTTKALFGVLFLVVALAGFVLWKGAHDRQADIARIKAWADSVADQAQRTARQFQSEVEGLREANQQSLAEIERLRRELSDAGSDAGTVARLRGQLEQAQARQQYIAGAGTVDYRAISARNQDAVALVLVEFSETERFSGSAFAVD
jgi:hypothetical protein